MNQPDQQKQLAQLVGFGLIAVLGLGYLNQSRYREISWKEFVESYLTRGNVERLEVVNNKWVKVQLNAGVDGDVIWFSIGSVDTFERNLENAQNELGIDVSRTVPVIYKTQMEMSNVISAIPTLLIFGLLIWSMRRAGSMMGRMAGKAGKGGGLFGGMMQSSAKVINPTEINV